MQLKGNIEKLQKEMRFILRNDALFSKNKQDRYLLQNLGDLSFLNLAQIKLDWKLINHKRKDKLTRFAIKELVVSLRELHLLKRNSKEHNAS